SVLSGHLPAVDVAATLSRGAVPPEHVARGMAGRSPSRTETRARLLSPADGVLRRPVRHLALGGVARWAIRRAHPRPTGRRGPRRWRWSEGWCWRPSEA